MSDDKIEEFAIRVALGNNGGKWATHYNEDQKEHWRQFIRDLIKELDNEYRLREATLTIKGVE